MLHLLKTGKSRPAFGSKRSPAKLRPSHNILHILPILVILVGFGFLPAYAQVSSAAFDPNCYQPKIGTPGVVDTIYGSYNGEQLGSFVKNIWQDKGEAYGNVVIDTGQDFRNRGIHPLYQSGPSFNLHKLQAKDTFNLGYLINPINLVKRGHFRSRQYTDALFEISGGDFAPRVYWADDQGKYDSTRYTELRSPKTGRRGIIYNDEIIRPYIGHLSSDTIDDIISGIILFNDSMSLDSVFYTFYKGGEHLNSQGKAALPDSIVYIDTFSLLRYCTQGDFRGTGREDLIANNGLGDAFFYKNDPPFSLQRFAYAMKYDTLMATWQNLPKGLTFFIENQLTMHAFNKPPGDSSVDFLPVNGNVGEVHIYKGGPSFGSHRLFESEADFVIHRPDYYDPVTWNGVSIGGAYDCGNIAGTGNHVLYRGGAGDGEAFGFDFFYVLGDAMDDKVDMYLNLDNGAAGIGGIDTLKADGSKFQDIILSHPGYGKNSSFDQAGTVWVIHGSKNIPDKTRSVRQSQSTNDVTFYPNPVTDGRATLEISGVEFSEADITIWDLLGRKVYSSHIRKEESVSIMPLLLQTLTSGTYILEVSGKNFSQKIQFSVLK